MASARIVKESRTGGNVALTVACGMLGNFTVGESSFGAMKRGPILFSVSDTLSNQYRHVYSGWRN